jgi:dTDP-4-amino-4,6-dideoxygalactose transaminase
MNLSKISFSSPHVSGLTHEVVSRALAGEALQGDGHFTKIVTQKLNTIFSSNTLLTHSCTGALEMAVMLAGVGPGDEVIVPDFTFSSTASAVALRGGIPVFVDVEKNTLNVDPVKVGNAITDRTKGIMVVHYGGVPADLSSVLELAKANKLKVIEDAAQTIGVTVKGKPLGTWGDFGCISFHATKNIQSGEGGALICSAEVDHKRAEIIREKGTDRSAFLRGEVDRYTWRDFGSSYLPSDLVAAYLLPQLDDIEIETSRRLQLWDFFKNSIYTSIEGCDSYIVAETDGKTGNGHVFGIVLPNSSERERFVRHMAAAGISVASHYVPLHSSPAGIRLGRSHGTLSNSKTAGDGLVRLPMHEGAEAEKTRIAEALSEYKFV